MNKLKVTIGGKTVEVEIGALFPGASQVEVKVGGRSMKLTLPDDEKMQWLLVEDRPYEVDFDHDLHWLKARGRVYPLEIHDMQAAVTPPRSGDGRVKAPIPGMVTRINVEIGKAVEAGQPVAVLEAMKMENEIRAPRAGTVRAVQAAPGQTVLRGQVLLEIE
ncbi:MAG: biotin/lipoyl-containing protein [Anaerolineae bacterium]